MIERLKQFFTRNLENPTFSLSDAEAWDAFGASAMTAEGALSISPVWAAVRRISSTVATLPLHVYRRTDEGREVARSHPLYNVLHLRPNPEQSSFVFREIITAHLLIYGDAVIEVERNARGDVIALWPVLPTAVNIRRVDGQRIYTVRVDGVETPLPTANVIHIPGFGLDGNRGLIPTKIGASTLRMAKAVDEYGAEFFENGTAPSGMLSVPGTLKKEGRDNLRDSWHKMHSGKGKRHRVAVLEEGVTYSPLHGIPPEDAQLIEVRSFNVSDVARLFSIPPHFLADLSRSTFSNAESESLSYLTHTIEPLTARIEQELTHALFREDPDHYAEFNLTGLLRADTAARSAYYTAGLNGGWLSINDVRRLENLNAVEGGDVHRVPLNTAPATNDEV